MLALRRNHLDQCGYGLGIALLVDTGRIGLDLSAGDWLCRFLSRLGIEAVPLRHVPALRSYRRHDLPHRDPADRLLIATAIEIGCPLVTYDERIARFGEWHGREYSFSVAV